MSRQYKEGYKGKQNRSDAEQAAFKKGQDDAKKGRTSEFQNPENGVLAAIRGRDEKKAIAWTQGKDSVINNPNPPKKKKDSSWW